VAPRHSPLGSDGTSVRGHLNGARLLTAFAVRALRKKSPVSSRRSNEALTRTRAVARRVPCTRRDTAKCVGLNALLDSHHPCFDRHAKDNRLRYVRVRRDWPQVKADSGQPSVRMQQPREMHGRGGEARQSATR
jgi:hypothetical protein